MLLNVVLQETVHDTWRWLLDPIHGYSVRGAYHFITKSLCLCGASFVRDCPLKIIWRGGESFNQLTRRVL